MMQPSPTKTMQEGSPADRSQQFVAVTGGKDTTSADTLLVIAYAAMWLCIFGFVWLTRKKQNRLDGRLDQLEKALARAEKSTDGD